MAEITRSLKSMLYGLPISAPPESVGAGNHCSPDLGIGDDSRFGELAPAQTGLKLSDKGQRSITDRVVVVDKKQE